MGKNTKNFRQSNQSRSGDAGARAYNQVNRNPWHQKLFKFINTRTKGDKR